MGRSSKHRDEHVEQDVDVTTTNSSSSSRRKRRKDHDDDDQQQQQADDEQHEQQLAIEHGGHKRRKRHHDDEHEVEVDDGDDAVTRHKTSKSKSKSKSLEEHDDDEHGDDDMMVAAADDHDAGDAAPLDVEHPMITELSNHKVKDHDDDDDSDNEASSSSSSAATSGLPGWLRGGVVLGSSTMALPRMSPYLSTTMLEILRRRAGLSCLFAVQAQVIPAIVTSDRDVCVCAPTGSGKTLAYAIPIVDALLTRRVPRTRALVLIPSRDLALQVSVVVVITAIIMIIMILIVIDVVD